MLFPPGSLPRGPKVETKKALLLLDLQNDFVDKQGNLYVANTASFLPLLPSLLPAFRAKGQVIWVQTVFRQPFPSLSPSTGSYGVLLKGLVEHLNQEQARNEVRNVDLGWKDTIEADKDVVPVIEDDAEAFLNARLPSKISRCCLPNSHGSELPDSLKSAMNKQQDMVLRKTQYSALGDINLVFQLRARMITDLYICGSLSNIGVYATVLDAVSQGFNITLIEDCLGYRDDACHTEAMRQMADDCGAEGIDYQELMDDLHGLLGDPIPASKYTRQFELGIKPQGALSRQQSAQKVSQWIDNMRRDSDESKDPVKDARNISSLPSLKDSVAKTTDDSLTQPQKSRASPGCSPARKRSTSQRDEPEITSIVRAPTSHTASNPRTSPDECASVNTSAKKSKTNPREETPSIKSVSPALSRKGLPSQSAGHSRSTGHLETSRKPTPTNQQGERTMSQPNILHTSYAATALQASPSPSTRKKKKKKPEHDSTYLGSDDTIGEGDTMIIYDVLPSAEADQAFEKLKHNTAWQKMFHRTGEVPRLVAVQGTLSPDGSIPIYRHPADESPPLLPFDETVDTLRKTCEEVVGHPLNHVLIQYYRSGEDNISEHSDKTLDIVRGSTIVNLSLGAMRTMTLRGKKISSRETAEPATAATNNGTPRTAQRIRLHHGSLFILGEATNASWLHSIRADKRPLIERSAEETAFNNERISLTFRHIGTFVDLENQLIWGQGATGKTRSNAKKIMQGKDAETVGEAMIIGFGRENHLNGNEFDWDRVYGRGFDVVNFEVKEPEAEG